MFITVEVDSFHIITHILSSVEPLWEARPNKERLAPEHFVGMGEECATPLKPCYTKLLLDCPRALDFLNA